MSTGYTRCTLNLSGSLTEYLAGQFGTDELLTEIRDGIEEIVNWLPHRETPAIESLEHMLTYGRELLAQYPDDDSELRKEVERSLTSAEAALREGRHNWATLRAEICAKLESNSEAKPVTGDR